MELGRLLDAWASAETTRFFAQTFPTYLKPCLNLALSKHCEAAKLQVYWYVWVVVKIMVPFWAP